MIYSSYNLQDFVNAVKVPVLSMYVSVSILFSSQCGQLYCCIVFYFDIIISMLSAHVVNEKVIIINLTYNNTNEKGGIGPPRNGPKIRNTLLPNTEEICNLKSGSLIMDTLKSYIKVTLQDINIKVCDMSKKG